MNSLNLPLWKRSLPIRAARGATVALALTAAGCTSGGSGEGEAESTSATTAAASGPNASAAGAAVNAALDLNQLQVVPADLALAILVDWQGVVSTARALAERFDQSLTDAQVGGLLPWLVQEADFPEAFAERIDLVALRAVTLAAYEDDGSGEGLLVFNREALRNPPAEGERIDLDDGDGNQFAWKGDYAFFGSSEILDRVLADDTERASAAAVFADFDGITDGAIFAAVAPRPSEITEELAEELGDAMEIRRFAASIAPDGAMRAAVDAPDASLVSNALGGAQQTLRTLVESLREQVPPEAAGFVDYAHLIREALWSPLTLAQDGSITRIEIAGPTCGEVPPVVTLGAAFAAARMEDESASQPFQPAQARLASTCAAMDGPAPNLRRDLARFGVGPQGAEGVVVHQDLGALLRTFLPTVGGTLPVAIDHGAIREALGARPMGLDVWGTEGTTIVASYFPSSEQFVAAIPSGLHSWVISVAGTPLPGEAVDGLGTFIALDPAHRATALDASTDAGIYATTIETVPESSIAAVVVPGSLLQMAGPLVSELPGVQAALSATRAAAISTDPDYASHLRLVVTGDAPTHATQLNAAVDGAVAAMLAELSADEFAGTFVRGMVGSVRARAESDTVVAVDLGGVSSLMPIVTALGVIGFAARPSYDEPMEWAPPEDSGTDWAAPAPGPGLHGSTGLGDDKPEVPPTGDKP